MGGSTKSQLEVAIEQGVSVSLDNATVSVTGPKGTLTRDMRYPGISIKQKDDAIQIIAADSSRALKVVKGTFAAHIKNMIAGVTNGFEYTLKVVNSHFPMTVKQQGSEISIDNFLGEKHPRKSKILGECSVSIKGDTISISGANIESVAQTASNIELATKVKGRDRRVFQDGIYIVSKGVAGQ